MRTIDKKDIYKIESQVVNKMFREDKRYRTKIIPNKKKEKFVTIKDYKPCLNSKDTGILSLNLK